MKFVYTFIFYFISLYIFRRIIKSIFKTRFRQYFPLETFEKECDIKIFPCFFKIICYSIFSIINVYIVSNESWSFRPKSYVLKRGFNNIKIIKQFYCLEFAFYILQLIYLFVEYHQKDFSVLLLHHLTTLFLIYGSYITYNYKYGIITMILHDTCDPFLEFSKYCIYIREFNVANIGFCIFVFVFFINRLLIYPNVTFITSVKLSLKYNIDLNFIYYALIIGLICIYIMNLIWSYFIFKVLIKIFKGKRNINDPRE